MNHEDQDSAQAGGAGGHHHQGWLTGAGGRWSSAPRPPETLLRLKRSIDLHEGSDGHLYLLRLGAGSDQVIESPSPAERWLLSLLADGFSSAAELVQRLTRAGARASQIEADIEKLVAEGLIEIRHQPRPLAEDFCQRFDRQLIYLADLAGAGESADQLQLRLARSRVLILGCGGLGSWVATGLGLCGVGSLVLVDDDTVELSNLNRQLLFGPGQIGQAKVEAASAALRVHSPGLEVLTRKRRIRCASDISDLLQCSPSLVISTADWPAHLLPRWVNRACLSAGTPWIGAGQFPPRLRIGPLVEPGESACFECLELSARREAPLYEEIAERRQQKTTPDPSTGPVSAVIGSLLASEAMHYLLGRAPASLGAVTLLDLQTMALERQTIVRNRDCPACARTPEMAVAT